MPALRRSRSAGVHWHRWTYRRIPLLDQTSRRKGISSYPVESRLSPKLRCQRRGRFAIRPTQHRQQTFEQVAALAQQPSNPWRLGEGRTEFGDLARVGRHHEPTATLRNLVHRRRPRNTTQYRARRTDRAWLARHRPPALNGRSIRSRGHDAVRSQVPPPGHLRWVLTCSTRAAANCGLTHSKTN
jgi:hypothetical protein